MNPERLAKIDGVLNRRQPDLTILAENLHKPRNFSALVRTCDAVGVGEIHTVRGEVDLRTHWNTSQGAEKWVNVVPYDTVTAAVANLRGLGFSIVAAHLSDKAVDYRRWDYTRPTALLMGTELFGVSETALEYVNTEITIPMMGMSQSLNVSVACALVLYEAQRQRMQAGMYKQRRLEDSEWARLRFRWLQPVVADYCDRHGMVYPELDEEGELIGGLPRV
jgi:tRNA (guanosine-2'-O-)-methyltransferase